MAASQPKLPDEYVEALRKKGFELEAFIGHGASGTVYRATQSRLKRSVAVKFFDGSNTKNIANRKRFDRERFLLAKIEHPSIPYILTDGEIPLNGDQVRYIVMQYIHGTKLATLIERRTKPDVNAAISTIQPILSALACAHKEHVIHRDIAPDNIIVGRQTTHLIDFSIGICTEYKAGLTRVTDLGDRIGRGDYASPEQKKDSSSVDKRTDVYSTGIVLFELLTGHPRFHPSEINQALSHAPAELRDIIKRACAEDREARFPTVDAFAEALQRLTKSTSTLRGGPMLSLCPNTKCRQAKWSHYGYFWGPRIEEKCTASYCESCGTRYIKNCSKCHSPLPQNLRDLVCKQSKSDNDATEAHCSTCGGLIFLTPPCKRCDSYLKREDLEKNTQETGCAKCRRTEEAPPPHSDDEIPF